MSDVELAHRAAFAGGPGILVLAGTGSIALARDRRGRGQRAGGWGPLLGDDGSGFWIGRSALRDPSLRSRLRLDLLAWAHAEHGARDIASLAPRILRLARTDPAARRISDAAAEHLADLAAQSCRGLRFSGPAPVAWWGGLFQDPTFQDRFRRALRRLARRRSLSRAAPQPPLLTAETAAAILRPPSKPILMTAGTAALPGSTPRPVASGTARR
jgi:N-acetylglucosamine kinase-like BadF-type ATPase